MRIKFDKYTVLGLHLGNILGFVASIIIATVIYNFDNRRSIIAFIVFITFYMLIEVIYDNCCNIKLHMWQFELYEYNDRFVELRRCKKCGELQIREHGNMGNKHRWHQYNKIDEELTIEKNIIRTIVSKGKMTLL
jgi:hypothetical protein